jgi:hypothetical protein
LFEFCRWHLRSVLVILPRVLEGGIYFAPEPCSSDELVFIARRLKMPVFRLTPRAGTETCPQWRASSMRPYCLWIRAGDEFEARRAVARATHVNLPSDEGGTIEPWKDADLVACEYDDSKDVSTGVIYVRRRPVVTQLMQQRRLSA